MTELPEHLKKLCDVYHVAHSSIKIEDGTPRCCDTCKHARPNGFTQCVYCTLEDVYFYRFTSCPDYERKAQN